MARKHHNKPEVLYHSKVFYYIQQIYQTELGRKRHRWVKSEWNTQGVAWDSRWEHYKEHTLYIQFYPCIWSCHIWHRRNSSVVQGKTFIRHIINTINTTDQQKLTEYLLTELDIYKLGILLCLFMGLRLGEICALKWEDIDMISRTLHVNRTVQRLPVDTVHTSGSSQNNHTATRKTSLYIDSPKTSNSLREIPIPDFIYDKLSDYYNTSMKGDSYFLKKNQPMDPRTYQNRFHIYIREAGIGNTHFHALRHTFATNCISSGADAKSVSEILGHSNVNITLNRYMHPNLETKRSAINSIVIP